MLPQDNLKPPKWHFKVWGVVVLLVLFGPLAFPFLWKTSTFSRRIKIILTVIFSILTILVTLHAIRVFNTILDQFRQIGLAQ